MWFFDRKCLGPKIKQKTLSYSWKTGPLGPWEWRGVLKQDLRDSWGSCLYLWISWAGRFVIASSQQSSCRPWLSSCWTQRLCIHLIYSENPQLTHLQSVLKVSEQYGSATCYPSASGWIWYPLYFPNTPPWDRLSLLLSRTRDAGSSVSAQWSSPEQWGHRVQSCMENLLHSCVHQRLSHLLSCAASGAAPW